MDSSDIYYHLLSVKENRGGAFFILIDPDKTDLPQYLALAEAAEDCGVDAILMGSSFTLESDFSESVRQVKNISRLPLIIFPGSFAQISPDADAVLFSSLISGRNPAYLIEEQVKGAPLVKKYNIEAIPTGYMLIESGPLTSVQYVSGSLPIPREKNDIACAHALAAQYLGMKLVYLEAGSGAETPVPIPMIRSVSAYVDIPVMTGGGLQSPEECAARVEAGASFIVVGSRLEKEIDFNYLKELTSAVHVKESISV